MDKQTALERIEVDGWLQAVEHFWDQGWTDGLPIIPPTEELVREFLECAGLEPGEIVGEYRDRARAITAEKLAVNAVMAGCKPEFMPVLVAVCKCLTAREFALNHIASVGSPWPLIIVNGPQVKQLGFNSGMYVFGPGNRANATVGRAMSLVLANCMDARIGGLQRGNIGHAARWGFCIAENEDTPWEPLHVQRGFSREANVVTVFPSGDCPRQVMSPHYNWSAEQRAEKLTRAIAGHRYGYTFGSYLLVVAPPLQEHFLKDGWTKSDLKRYIMENAYLSIAELKRMGGWWQRGSADGEPPPIEPGDEERKVYIFKREPWYEDAMWDPAERTRTPDVLIVVAGGDAGASSAVVEPYCLGAEPVSTEVISRQGRRE